MTTSETLFYNMKLLYDFVNFYTTFGEEKMLIEEFLVIKKVNFYI